jgi:hypothetical protein
MQQEVLIVRRGKGKQPCHARFSLTARALRPGAPPAITVTVQLGSNGWTRLVTAAALAPDVAGLARDVWGAALPNIDDTSSRLSKATSCAARSIDPAKVIPTANAGQQGARP